MGKAGKTVGFFFLFGFGKKPPPPTGKFIRYINNPGTEKLYHLLNFTIKVYMAPGVCDTSNPQKKINPLAPIAFAKTFFGKTVSSEVICSLPLV